MKDKFWLKLAAFMVGLLTLPLGPLIWPPNPELPTPNQLQLILLIGVSIFEAIAFGYGYYFLIEGHRLMKEKKTNLNFLTYLAIAWSLMSWWPHDKLHMHIGMDISRLIFIEYGFHVTLILSAVVIAHFFYAQLRAMKKQ